MSKTILSIGSKTRPENETIDIFGVAYKTLTVEGKNDIKIGARAKDFARRYKGLNLAAIDIEEITPGQAEEVQMVVNDLTRIILPGLPVDVLEDLNDLEKLEILEAYFNSHNGKNLLAAAGVNGPVALAALPDRTAIGGRGRDRGARPRQKATQSQAS